MVLVNVDRFETSRVETVSARGLSLETVTCIRPCSVVMSDSNEV